MKKAKVEICLSPALYDLYKEDEQIVVVIDVIRASTSICLALSNGINKLYPVLTIDDAMKHRKKGRLIAGENQSIKLDGFDFGNSPYEFIGKQTENKELAIITTNGTNAILKAKNADQLIIASFINFDYALNFLLKQNKNILLLCSGWTNKINIEDTLFAGKLSQALLKSNKFSSDSDSVSIASELYNQASADLYNFVLSSSPRLKSKLSFLEKDIRFCLFSKQLKVLPVYTKGYISKL